jgi:hypothetical protein
MMHENRRTGEDGNAASKRENIGHKILNCSLQKEWDLREKVELLLLYQSTLHSHINFDIFVPMLE